MIDYIKENVISLIAALGALTSMFFSYRASKQTNYINNITSERIKWLSNIKGLTAKYIALCYSFQASDFKELVELSKLLLLSLNPKEDEAIIKCIRSIIGLTIDARNELDNQKSDDSFLVLADKADELLVNVQAKCKYEWEKIKNEAGYNYSSNYQNVKIDIELLTKEYNKIYEYKNWDK